MNMDVSMKKPVRWHFLLIGSLSMLFSGIIYAWSILKTPFSTEFGWTASQLALNFTLIMCFFCIGGMAAGMLIKKTSPKTIVIFSALFTCFGFILVSVMSGRSIFTLYLSYGLLCGFGIGMAYNVIIATVNSWFPDKKGTCSGILMMSFGASTLILGNIASHMFKADNIGWRNTYMVLGIATGIILLFAALFLKFPPDTVQLPRASLNKKSNTREDFESRDYTTSEMIRRFTFWRFFLFLVTLAATGSTVISFARDLAINIGATETLAITLVGVLSVFNGLGRIICGVLFDLAGRKKAMLFANIVTISAPTILLISLLTSSVVTGILGFCLVGISYGCAPTISSAFIGSFYGTKYFSLNFSIANTMLIPASFTATLAGALITGTGSYIAPIILLIALAIMSLLLNLSIKRP